MAQKEQYGLDDVVAQVTGMTRSLLDEGIEPSLVAFALTSVAADMGLKVCGDLMRVFPVLLGAISQQAHRRTEADRTDEEETPARVPVGSTMH